MSGISEIERSLWCPTSSEMAEIASPTEEMLYTLKDWLFEPQSG